MLNGGWVASDATRYSLEDQRPDWVSLVSVAVGVKSISDFNDDYFDIVEDKLDAYDIPVQHPIIKNQDVNRWGKDWQRKEMRRDIVTELLTINSIDTMQIIETSLHSRWVTVFQGDEQKKNRVRSEEFINEYLQPYYNIISLWEYLRKNDKRPRTHRNVMTDDFSGKLSPAWIQIGKMTDEFRVVPKGDQTYPLLSLADLIMELVKQEVDDWNEDEIYNYLKPLTPADSAWVDSDGINNKEELAMIAPHTSHNINTNLHYPHPVLFIDTGNIGSSTATSLDFFDHAAKFARESGGCLKFFNERQDRDYITGEDYLICLNDNTDQYSHLNSLNDQKAPTVLNIEQSKDLFSAEFNAYND